MAERPKDAAGVAEDYGPVGHLVLTRKPGERFRIFDMQTRLAIWVGVVEVSGSRVRIDIEAPHDVSVLREELLGTLAVAHARRGPAVARLEEENGRLRAELEREAAKCVRLAAENEVLRGAR